ncbi:nicotinamide riboside transporter PnuC [Bacteroides fluxus]|uniref:nicotinamide riboside transporter PnuC n=1 Tax=Bacteroides fluxus TaxID=626930 RepID=UPI00235601A6|nr:nicotinamide riboside transporter PnuC [Bacteroides fluxus]MDY3790395.1 nicotinamide riboside transporter PnuC [Bacteroides fluxus]
MEHTLEIAGTLIGILYLWLEYRASIYLWIAGIIMPAVYIFVYYDAGLYADFGINIYYLGAAIYGWTMWKYGSFLRRKILRKQVSGQQAESPELPITRMPARYLLPLAAAFAVAFTGIAWILIRFTDSNVPWLDSFTTALSIVGMWMLARKYVEQWWAWIAVDAVSAGLYIYKGLDFTAALYALYTIIAIFGYFKWKRMMDSEVPFEKFSGSY